MNRKWLVIGIVVLVVAALVGVSVANAQGPRGGRGGGMMGGPENSLISIAADALGLDQTALVAELQSGKTIAQVAEAQGVELAAIVDAFVAERAEQLNALVTSGQLTQEQVDARLEVLKTDLTERLSQPIQGRGFGLGGPANSLITIVAETLGIEPAALLTELQAGKTVAEVAEANDVALQTIVDAVIAAHTEQLNALVAGGQLTQEQADARLALMQADLNVRLTQPFEGRGFGWGGGMEPGDMWGRGMGPGGMMDRPGFGGRGMGPGGMMDRPGFGGHGMGPGGMWGQPDQPQVTPEAPNT